MWSGVQLNPQGGEEQQGKGVWGVKGIAGTKSYPLSASFSPFFPLQASLHGALGHQRRKSPHILENLLSPASSSLRLRAWDSLSPSLTL